MKAKKVIALGISVVGLSLATFSLIKFVNNEINVTKDNPFNDQEGVSFKTARLETRSLEEEEDKILDPFTHTISKDGKYYLRYSVPVDGNGIDDFSFTRTVGESDTNIISIDKIYKKIVIDGGEYYYNPNVYSKLSTTNPDNGYYFACYCVEISTPRLATEISVVGTANYVDQSTFTSPNTISSFNSVNSINKVEVKFIDDDDSLIEKQIVTKGSAVTAPDVETNWVADGKEWNSGDSVSKDTIVKTHECTNFLTKFEENTYWDECSACGRERQGSRAEHNCKNVSAPSNKIGFKHIKCDDVGCDFEADVPMPEESINKEYGYSAYTTSGTTQTGDSLHSEYPEYSGSTIYRSYSVNSSTIDMGLPRVDYRAFNNVMFVLHTNGTGAQFVGFGLNEANDLITSSLHGWHPNLSVFVKYNSLENVLEMQIKLSFGEQSRWVTINDNDIILGNTCLTLKFSGGAYRSAVLDNVYLNHECTTFVDIDKDNEYVLGLDKICKDCFEHQNNLAAKSSYEGDELYNAQTYLKMSVNNYLGVSKGNNGVKFGGNQSSRTNGIITLPKVNFKSAPTFNAVFSCNTTNSVIGENASNCVNTLQSDSTIKMHYNGNKISIELTTSRTISWDIYDENVINGYKGAEVYVDLPAYNFIELSYISINEYANIEINELNLDTYSNNTSAYQNHGWVYGINKETFGDINAVILPKIDFNSVSYVVIEGTMNEGSKIGLLEGDMYYYDHADLNNELFTIVYKKVGVNKLKSILTIYRGPEQYTLRNKDADVFNSSNLEIYKTFDNIVCIKEQTITNSDIINGDLSANFYFSFFRQWNERFSVGLASVCY